MKLKSDERKRRLRDELIKAFTKSKNGEPIEVLSELDIGWYGKTLIPVNVCVEFEGLTITFKCGTRMFAVDLADWQLDKLFSIIK